MISLGLLKNKVEAAYYFAVTVNRPFIAGVKLL